MGDKSFEEQLRAILDEGKGYGFTPSDSLLIKTADGQTVHTYRFKTGSDGIHHGLGIVDSPGGTLILRYQAATESIWKKEGDAVLSMLKGLSFKKK